MATYIPEEYIAARSAKYASDSRLPILIDQAGTETGTAYGDNQNRAISLLVLHWLTMDDRDPSGTGNGGIVSMEKEGSLQKQYLVDFALTSKYPDLTQTRWGMELISLRRSSIFGPRTRITAV